MKTVAKAVRLEIDTDNNELYIVFKVVDSDFAKNVRDNWEDDIPVELMGKDLIKRR